MTESASQPLEMHIRIKRKNTVLFLYVEPSETILDVKDKIETLLGQPAADQRLKKGEQVLDDDTSKLQDLSIQFDDELFLLFRLPGSGNWEAVDQTLLEGSIPPMQEAKA